MDTMQQPAILPGTTHSPHKRQRDFQESQHAVPLKPSHDTRIIKAISKPHHVPLGSSTGKFVSGAASNSPSQPTQPDVPRRPLGECFASKAALLQTPNATPPNPNQPGPTTNAIKRPASISFPQLECKRSGSSKSNSKLCQLQDDLPQGILHKPYNPRCINQTKTMPSVEDQHLSNKGVSPIQKTAATATTCEQQHKRTTSDPEQENPQKLASFLSSRDPRVSPAQYLDLCKDRHRLDQEFLARPRKRKSTASAAQGNNHYHHAAPVEKLTQPSSGDNTDPGYKSTSQMKNPRRQQGSISEALHYKSAPAPDVAVRGVETHPRAGESLSHRDMTHSANLQPRAKPGQPTPVLDDCRNPYVVSARWVPQVPEVLSKYWRLVPGARKCIAVCKGLEPAQRSLTWTANLHAGPKQRMVCSIPPHIMSEIEGKFYLGWLCLHDDTLVLVLSVQKLKQLTIFECKVQTKVHSHDLILSERMVPSSKELHQSSNRRHDATPALTTEVLSTDASSKKMTHDECKEASLHGAAIPAPAPSNLLAASNRRPRHQKQSPRSQVQLQPQPQPQPHLQSQPQPWMESMETNMTPLHDSPSQQRQEGQQYMDVSQPHPSLPTGESTALTERLSVSQCVPFLNLAEGAACSSPGLNCSSALPAAHTRPSHTQDRVIVARPQGTVKPASGLAKHQAEAMNSLPRTTQPASLFNTSSPIVIASSEGLATPFAVNVMPFVSALPPVHLNLGNQAFQPVSFSLLPMLPAHPPNLGQNCISDAVVLTKEAPILLLNKQDPQPDDLLAFDCPLVTHQTLPTVQDQPLPLEEMPKIFSSTGDGEMQWSVNKALIMALDFLGSTQSACMALEAAVSKLEVEKLRAFVNKRYQWVRRAYRNGDGKGLRQLIKAEMGVDV